MITSTKPTFVMLIAAIGSIAITIMCWAAWLQEPVVKSRLIGSLSIAICHTVMGYQIGYKSYYLDGSHKYAWLAWLLPAILSLIGAFIGLSYL